MSLTPCRDCQLPIMFVAGVPHDYEWYTCPKCGHGAAIAQQIHFRNRQHIDSVKAKHQKRQSTRATKSDTKSHGLSTVQEEALAGLVRLGFKAAEAKAKVLESKASTVEDILRDAFAEA